jgi:hypothetical protein
MIAEQQQNIPKKKLVLMETVKGVAIGALLPAGVAAVEAVVMRKTHPTFSGRFDFRANTQAVMGSLKKDSVVAAMVLGLFEGNVAHSYNKGVDDGILSSFTEKVTPKKDEEITRAR